MALKRRNSRFVVSVFDAFRLKSSRTAVKAASEAKVRSKNPSILELHSLGPNRITPISTHVQNIIINIYCVPCCKFECVKGGSFKARSELQREVSIKERAIA